MRVSFTLILMILLGAMAVLGQDARDETPFAPTSTVVTFSSPGSGSWTAPAGITWVRVEVWGAGGSGGAAAGNIFSSAYAGGGGGGAYSRSVIQVVPGTAYPLFVGSSSGGNGLASSFNSNQVSAAGGTSGANSFSNGGQPGGIGGATSSGIGAVRFSGGFGGNGISGTGAGGGGGSAGPSSAGLGGLTPGGAAPVFGGGSGGTGGTVSGGGLGTPGSAPGGGGGGAASNGAQIPGALGGSGRIVLTFPAIFSISGRVLTSNGRGIRGAIVTISGGQIPNVSVHTGRYGMYSIPNLPEGSYTLTVTSRRFTFTPPSRTVSSTAGVDLTSQDIVAN